MSIDFNASYYLDPYCKEFIAEVVEVGEAKDSLYPIFLNQSYFYPEGGGQPGDHGYLNDVEVVDTVFIDGKEAHLCKAPIEPGTKVEAKLDFERRFELMQQHSGEHLISGLAKEHYGCTNVGFHIGEEEMTLDFDRKLKAEEIANLEVWANEVVFANLPFEVIIDEAENLENLDYRSKLDLKGQVRVIKVPEVDLCACCGTHVKTTGEIGLIKLVHWMNYKEGVRITALCGRRALRDYQLLQQQAESISQLNSSKSRELEAGVRQLHDQLDQVKAEVKARSFQILEFILQARGEKESIFWLDSAGDKDSLKDLAKKAAEALPGMAILLVEDEGQIRYSLAAKDRDLTELHQALKDKFSCRGGGKKGYFQGSLEANTDELRDFFLAHEFGGCYIAEA